MSTSPPTVVSVLSRLSRPRIAAIARSLGLRIPSSANRAEQARRIAEVPTVDLRDVLTLLVRDELRDACIEHGLDADTRARAALIQRLANAAGLSLDDDAPDVRAPDGIPRPGDIAVVRQRQYLVESVQPSGGRRVDAPLATRVSLVCLDDDAQGRGLDVLWELELGARVIEPEKKPLDGGPLDPPDAFAAYLRALQWSCVTATDAGLFQAPFRAGVHLMHHQMTPLAKALALPRANLFIADDVGLGKTIEAGLVAQELILRQRVDTILIVCPPAVSLQWRDEMRDRFGLRFEIHDRDFVARRRAERGFGTNPWSTHNRFIISYQTLRRDAYLEPLLQHLGDRARRSLLIMDEAHTVAPASGARYAVDSALTKIIRDHVAPRFENRLFLSATPHNGHSNSFAALLEILDPQRFTRGIPIEDPETLEPVMVRRLKSDLHDLAVVHFPTRVIQRRRFTHTDGRWSLVVESGRPDRPEMPIEESDPIDLGASDAFELTLADDLARYTALMAPATKQGRLVFINLQKRLLSSVPALWRTFAAHCKRLDDDPIDLAPRSANVTLDEAHGPSDDAADEAETDAVERGSALLSDPNAEAAALRRSLRTLADKARHRPDARMRAIVHWIAENQCPAAAIGGAAKGASTAWSKRRLIIFTEYADTRRYIEQQLRAALAGTDRAEERVMRFGGGMSDDQRAEVKRAFNADPATEPVRILVATDAAREGINLQAWCADLMHFDVPWNPARIEQRNGRIDRTLQPEPEVRCGYFSYTQRREDRVLDTLVRKVDVIRRELGSVGSVVLDRIEATLADGIADDTADAIDGATDATERERTAAAEVESQRTRERVTKEIDRARKTLDASRKVIGFEPETLRGVIDIGLGFLGLPSLAPVDITDPSSGKTIRAWTVPEMPADWQGTMDTLRPPRPRDIPPWEWRKTPTLPVVFVPPPRLTSPVVHLHLEHPFAKRILSRFRAQGFAAHDLRRATVLGDPHHATPMAIALGRLSLFGPGATRLHDELITIGAPWLEGGGDGHLAVDPDDTAIKSRLDRLLGEPVRRVEPQEKRLAPHAAADFGRLWSEIDAEAEARAHDAEIALTQRAETEQNDLRRILEAQRAELESRVSQLELDLSAAPKAEQRQYQDDRRHMARRLQQLQTEIESEPAQLAELYRVVRRRVEPVGLVYLWPVMA